MNRKRLNPEIINALVWAGLMLATAWTFNKYNVDTSGGLMSTMTGFLIAGWFTTNGLIRRAGANVDACVRPLDNNS